MILVSKTMYFFWKTRFCQRLDAGMHMGDTRDEIGVRKMDKRSNQNLKSPCSGRTGWISMKSTAFDSL